MHFVLEFKFDFGLHLDVLDRAKSLLAEFKASPDRLVRMSERMQGLASVLLTHGALSEALAYTLQVGTELLL